MFNIIGHSLLHIAGDCCIHTPPLSSPPPPPPCCCWLVYLEAVAAKSPLPSESVWATDMNGLIQQRSMPTRREDEEEKQRLLYWTHGIANVTCYKTVSSDSCVAAALFLCMKTKGGTQNIIDFAHKHTHTHINYSYSPDENFTLVIVDSIITSLSLSGF